jgi:hypothetical protein
VTNAGRNKLRSTPAAALFVALQLCIAAPAPLSSPSPRADDQVAAQHHAAAVVARVGHRPAHRVTLDAPPFLPPLRALGTPPAGATGFVYVPHARASARRDQPRFAGPRGPPLVAVS